jgi:mRNA-degrading endonuclease toxin of MazEF toxin-antitoxin module
LKAWEIYSYQPPEWASPHPCVIISHSDRVANKPEINILMCSSQRAQRQPKPNEIILDQADGLNWPTLCKCDLIHAVEKSDLTQRRGAVTSERKRQIIATINRAMGWV